MDDPTDPLYEQLRDAVLAADRAKEAVARLCIGERARCTGDTCAAAQHFETALQLLRELGDGPGQVRTHRSLAALAEADDDREGALTHYQEALATCQALGLTLLEAQVARDLGRLALRVGDLTQARSHFAQERQLGREIGEPGLEAAALLSLGDTELWSGEPKMARTSYLNALTLASTGGTRYVVTGALRGLGDVASLLGEPERANRFYAEALERVQAPGDAYPKALRSELERLVARLTEMAVASAFEAGAESTADMGTFLDQVVGELEPLCRRGLMADFTLRDGTRLSGVLVAVSRSGLIIERWNGEEGEPCGELLILDLANIAGMTIP